MISSTVRIVAVAFFLALFSWDSSASCGQVDSPGFKALPRPINYATPLAPANGAKAVIVYGKDAPWTKSAAEAAQKAVADWCGAKLEMADDRGVTGEDTWLLGDAYRKTPLIVLGNAQDNRVMHALGTRYLLQSNRSWPGGDRYYIRTVFEPFVADVNYIVLEASNQAGMDAAAAKFAELLKGFPADAKVTATIPPRLRVQGGLKDKWNLLKYDPARCRPQLPPEMFRDLNRGLFTCLHRPQDVVLALAIGDIRPIPEGRRMCLEVRAACVTGRRRCTAKNLPNGIVGCPRRPLSARRLVGGMNAFPDDHNI